MDDSNSFSSLMDLVNNHLSKTSLGGSQPGEGSNFPLACVSIQTGQSQTVFTPPNGIMSIPRLGAQENEINNILAQQVTNMLIAKEKRKQEDEERQRHSEEMNRLKRERQKDDYVIDLMSCIVLPDTDKPTAKPLEDYEASSSSSSEFESLLVEVNMISSIDDKTAQFKKLDMLPLKQDMSYMLSRKVTKGKPSAFGKVICSRVRPVAAPYVKIEINNPTITRFDFSTRSPCDINMEKRRHPPQDPYAHMNMVERFMAQTKDASQHM